MLRSPWLRVNRPAFVAALLLVLAAPVAAAEGVVSMARGSSEARAAWTAQRMREAKPFPLAQVEVDESVAAELALELAGAPAVTEPTDALPGGTPVPGLRLASRRLFNPPAATMADEAVAGVGDPAFGTAKGYFTSQRLVPVTANTAYPYSTVGVLFFTIPGEGDFFCSAAVLNRRLVVTAAGCVHQGSGGNNGFYTDFLFAPGYREGVAPLGVWEWEYVVAHNTWTQGGGNIPNAADYAVIEVGDLVCQGGVVCRLGEVTGWLGFVINKLRPNHAHILGYSSNFDNATRTHQVTAQALRAAAANNVEYGGDLRGGSAGSPVIQDFGDNSNLVKWIGTVSWYNTNAAIKTLGISTPDSRFTGLRTSACNHRPGNCS